MSSLLKARTGDNSLTIRQRNRALVMSLIFRLGPVSRLRLAEETGLTSGALSKITSELISEGIVAEVGSERQENAGPGRTPVLLDFIPNRNGVIAVNISRHFVEAALIDLRGRLLATKKQAIPDGSFQDSGFVTELISESISELRREGQALGFSVYRIGVGCPGIVDPVSQNVLFSSTMKWQHIPFGKLLSRVVDDTPVTLSNNVKAMSLAEQWFGEKAGTGNLVLIYIGHGIGCGQVIGGRIYTGSHFRAGEYGHIIVEENGEECYCGKKGCLETVASTRAIISRVKSYYRLRSPSPEVDGGQWDEERVLRLGADGDTGVIQILEEAGKYLGKAAVNLVNLLDPDVIVLAGRFITPESPVVEAFREALSERAFTGGSMCSVVISSLGDRLGLLGGAAVALKEIFAEIV